MTPNRRRKAPVTELGPFRLASAIEPPENPRPKAKPKRPLPAGLEALLGIDDLAALLSCSRRLVERMEMIA